MLFLWVIFILLLFCIFYVLVILQMLKHCNVLLFFEYRFSFCNDIVTFDVLFTQNAFLVKNRFVKYKGNNEVNVYK